MTYNCEFYNRTGRRKNCYLHKVVPLEKIHHLIHFTMKYIQVVILSTFMDMYVSKTWIEAENSFLIRPKCDLVLKNTYTYTYGAVSFFDNHHKNYHPVSK